MKKIAFFSLFFVMAFYAGCSTVKFSPTQSITQTCPANLNSNSESKEKQCCLKDTLNITVKPVVETCKPDSEKDSLCSNPTTKSTTDSIKKNKIYNQIKNDIQNKIINDINSKCSNSACNGNNIHIENIITTESSKSKDEEKEKFWNKLSKKLQENKWCNLLLLTIIFLLPLIGGHLIHFFQILKKYIILSFLICRGIINYLYNFIIIFFQKNFHLLSVKIKNCHSVLNNSYLRTKHLIKNIFDINTYNSLAPIDNADISEDTLKQLKYSIIDDNKKIKNIAITGPYGSGKSSVWLTFCKNYKITNLKNVVQISLANFCEKQENKIIYANTETEIERAIIQQLIYSKKNSQLKYSSFPKIKNLSNIKTSFITTIFLISFSIILFFSNDSFFNFIISWIKTPYLLGTIYIGFSFLIVYILLFLFIQKYNQLKISKICIKEIEFTLGDDTSYFNKYINEIVYFFEATGCNCVVFEDLDRFHAPKIFTKLRELNTLVNNYPAIKDTVKFVYIIKDDILIKYERTKFFDFIIPVIPILSTYNSMMKLTNLSKNNSFYLSHEYLQGIKKYFKDYRLAKNCFNEAIIYKGESLYSNNSTAHNYLNYYGETKYNEKIFSLTLYKNLYPKDFSKLYKGKGILYYCLEDFFAELDQNGEIKPIKDYLLKNETREALIKEIRNLNENYKYKEDEKINPQLLIHLLSNGCIERDYKSYITKSKDQFLTQKQQAYLFNIHNNIPDSFQFRFSEDELIQTIDEIQDYEWNSLGILNNDAIDFILKKDNNKQENLVKIVDAMYTYDSKNSENFIPSYFRHCILLDVNIQPLLEAIEEELSNICPQSNILENNIDSDLSELINPDFSINYNNAIKFLECCFIHSHINIFHSFLDISRSIFLNRYESNAIGLFLDKNDSFKKVFFEKTNDFDYLLAILEDNRIRILLTQELCQKLIDKNKLSSSIYRINKRNFDLILTLFNLKTNESYYLTRCLQIDNLDKRILKTTYSFFKKILFTFTEVDEDYLTLKKYFDKNNSSTHIIDIEDKEEYFKKIPSKWEKFVIYNRYASFDNYLSKSIKEFIHSNSSNQEISESLQKDETGIKEFIRAVIKNSNIDNSILLQHFLPFWGNYIAILNCYEGEEQEIQNMTPERNHLLQKYMIDYVRNRPSDIMIDLMIKEPNYFIKNYPDEEYAKESKFKLSVLNSDSENLIEIKQRFFKNISFSVLLDDDEQKFNIYKKAGKQIKKYNLQNQGFLHTIKNQIGESVKNLKTVKSLIYFKQFPLNINILRIKGLSNFTIATDDPWSLLLFRNLTYWTQKLCNFIEEKTTTLSTDTAGIKPPDNNNENTVKEINAAYQNIVKNIEFWVNELDEYIKDFK